MDADRPRAPTAQPARSPPSPPSPAPDGQARELEVLDDAECRRLLGTASIGRLAFSEGALPAIEPVAFALDGDRVLIPTPAGSRAAVASRRAVVAFAVDDVDGVSGTGWDVTVIGPSRVISDPHQVAALDAAGPRSSASAGEHWYIAVQSRVLRGRRIRR
jgi:uncharacterized protein